MDGAAVDFKRYNQCGKCEKWIMAYYSHKSGNDFECKKLIKSPFEFKKG